MKKIILLLSLSLFTILTACAQQKEFITYTIKKGESVRDLAKRYDVRSKEILRLNPGLKRKPKVNTTILIPNVNYKEEVAKIIASENHIIQPKETLYGISKEYNVSIKALLSINPEASLDSLKIGMVLQIPSEKMLTPEQLRQNELHFWEENFELHTVVKDDTLYSLTRFYNVSDKSLLALNPVLSEGLKLGMVLKIKEKISDKELEIIKELVFIDRFVYKDTIDVAMLLPFKFSKNDTLTKDQLFSTKHNLVSIITDFYLGAEIAFDSLRKQDVLLDVKIFDSENNKDTIKGLIKQDVFKNTDVVFGPVFNQHVDNLAAELKDIPVVFPFYSGNQKKFKGKNIVKTATDREVLSEKVLSYFSEIYTSAHILIVGDEKSSSKQEFLEIEKFLKKNNDSVKEVRFLQPENGYISNERFLESVDTLAVNWVVLTTNNKVVTADVMNNLKSIPNDAEVRLFAFEKSSNFDKVDNNLLAEMNFVCASSGVLVDSLPNISNFYAQYLKKNKAYPSEFSLRGFDIVYDVLSRMASNDSLSFSASFDKGVSKRVRSTFEYKQKLFGGPVYNTAVYLQKYNEDLTVHVIELQKEEALLVKEEIIEGKKTDGVKGKNLEKLLDISKEKTIE
jgi:LysM repeat protein